MKAVAQGHGTWTHRSVTAQTKPTGGAFEMEAPGDAVKFEERPGSKAPCNQSGTIIKAKGYLPHHHTKKWRDQIKREKTNMEKMKSLRLTKEIASIN